MAHFEFGQERLAQPHPLKTFELAQGAIKGAFVLFSTTATIGLKDQTKLAFSHFPASVMSTP